MYYLSQVRLYVGQLYLGFSKDFKHCQSFYFSLNKTLIIKNKIFTLQLMV